MVGWTDPTTVDISCPHDEARSKASGLTPPRLPRLHTHYLPGTAGLLRPQHNEAGTRPFASYVKNAR
ncbi:hypothetical protein B1Q88_004322 [Salmonella enterica subsp. enterica serovar Bredeney]|nr:hypothetical protein EAE34_23900 [Salmonella enterica subsp. enterica serovar Anatum]EAO0810278.1 hypothetical protein [Salmonella enterica]EAW3954118.1 hypothetical protein [Salmonella enterica subsp. enterica]EBM9478765.1 hypothetical protein [Salmonella enterica subsp. enterica serovar Rubislaw]EDC0986895.1 hypothetical protein [Salmonella enterica subsp. enterica serovar Give]EDI1814882.1 hypothetical protein [Salmonella enterica subsp. enterica serovar Dublin]EDL0726655.1 hypothetical